MGVTEEPVHSQTALASIALLRKEVENGTCSSRGYRLETERTVFLIAQNGLGDAHESRANAIIDVCILLDEVETGLARNCGAPGTSTVTGAPIQLGIVAGSNPGGIDKLDGVIQIHRFAFGFAPAGLDQNDFRGEAANKQSISKGRAGVAKADDGDAAGDNEMGHQKARLL